MITEKSSSNTELTDERNGTVELAAPAFNLLNTLEQVGYKVIISSSSVTGPNIFDTTLYKPLCEARTPPSPADTNEVKNKKSGRMPYVCVRENAVK